MFFNKKNETNWKLVIVAVFGTAILAFLIYYGFNFPDNTDTIQLPGKTAVTHPGTAGSATTAVIKEEAAASSPILTPEQVKANEAKLQLAMKTGDTALCGELNGSLKDECLDTIILNKVSANNDAALCQQITSEEVKKKCLEIAQDPKQMITNSPVFKTLVEDYKNNKMTDMEYGEYIKMVASLQQPYLCMELPDQLQQICYDRAYVFMAMNSDDLKLCEKPVTIAWKNECNFRVILYRAEKAKNPRLCAKPLIAADIERCKNQVSQ